MSKLDFGYPEVGKQRLGRLIQASLKMQDLSYRDAEELTGRLYYKCLNKGTISSYVRGHLVNYQMYTLQKFAFLLFKVAYFQVTEDDQVGSIVFENGIRALFDRKGKLIKNSISILGDQHLEKLKTLTSVEELPLLSERYTDHRALEAILNCESEVRTAQSSTVERKGVTAVS